MTEQTPLETFRTSSSRPAPRRWRDLLHVTLLGVVLLAGTVLRLAGSDWGEYQYLHPDERFLIWVGSDISPVESVGEYFDTENSSLNPHNRGHNFYVYGTLPMFITRYVVEWVYGHSGFNEMTDVGRILSAVADLGTLMLVYLIALRLYNRRTALLATAFSAFAVLQIQQAHFFTMDTFINFFTLLAFYFAVQVATPEEAVEMEQIPPEAGRAGWRELPGDSLLWLCVGFGIALGMAVASKLNAALMAAALPIALGLRLSRLHKADWERHLPRALAYLGMAAVLSVLVFRIAQPYAFSGPGFFGLTPNPKWVANIKELAAQGAGDVDMPPSLQWARRPITYAWENMVKWGFGLPLGLLAWAGFLFAAWRMLKGEWRRHLLLWGWTAFYFAWWARAFNPTMRYFLPVYPTLAIFAAWGVVYAYDRFSQPTQAGARQAIKRAIPVLVGGLVLAATALWAAAFTSIYTRPITRVEASRWIYQNIPGAINIQINTGEEQVSQPAAFPYTYRIQPNLPYNTVFTPQQSGWLTEVQLPHVLDQQLSSESAFLSIVLTQGETQLTSSLLEIPPTGEAGPPSLVISQPLTLMQGLEYTLTISNPILYQQVDLCGVVTLDMQTIDIQVGQILATPADCLVSAEAPVAYSFTVAADAQLKQIRLSQAELLKIDTGEKTLTLTISGSDPSSNLGRASVTSRFAPQADGRGAAHTLHFETPIPVEAGQNYWLEFSLAGTGGALSLTGAAVANEGDWDDGLPVRVDGYDGFGGIYQPGLNFNMYTDDNAEKRDRFLRILNEADYLLISSNRQWGSLPRLAERFPMTTVYYRELMGCPMETSIFECYAEAEPGMFEGRLGFELVQVFQSDPQLGRLKINDQYAEEAFHVYEHPKVLIFKKQADYDPSLAQKSVGRVDLSRVVRLTPKRAGDYPATLMLPADRLAEQQAGGTWSDIFDTQAWPNRYQPLGVILWYLGLSLLGWLVYPVLRQALAGLPDRGYPLARTAGVLSMAYLAWLAGSLEIPFERITLNLIVLLMLIVGVGFAWFQRAALAQEWRERKRYFLSIEALTLLFFLAFLLVRLGNPDLWHPWKGGEKPMDFAYFNAVMKSTSFPPYDPWMAGGYLNYYYFGFVLFGVPVKWLGIVPSFAYNLILASAFSMVAMGAFSVAWNLASARRSRAAPAANAFYAGLAGALGTAVLGNLGTLRMIWLGYQRISDPALADTTLQVSFFYKLAAGFDGFFKMIAGANLPYGFGDWYWYPSRLVPPGDEAIMEFPAFTFTYADPHAHLYALPIALLCLAWAVSAALGGGWGSGKGWKAGLRTGLSLLLGGLAVGALRPTNTWDYPTYLALGVVALAYGMWRHLGVDANTFRSLHGLAGLADLPAWVKRLLLAGAASLALVLLSSLLYQPYTQWYGQGYNSVIDWTGPRTPLGVYFTHWGLFLFAIVFWLGWETIHWMAHTPASALRRVDWPTVSVIGGLLVFTTLVLSLKISGVDYTQNNFLANVPIGRGAVITLLAIPLAAWAGVLLLRPGQTDAKRVALFLTGTALAITVVVELVVLQGDIGRMNTVFKLYLQAWILLASAAAGAFAWTFAEQVRWRTAWRLAWQIGLAFLVGAAALFPLLGMTAKIKDRMANGVPLTLDGMDYMQVATYDESGTVLDLSQDHAAIRWMQDHVQGSPVIVEANSGRLYRWYGRFSIYTGLPGVVGWEWHQQQQRALTPGEWVSSRLREIDAFYTGTDALAAYQFLQTYQVKYIILGQLEKATYAGAGLDKFTANEGILWQAVYQDRDTTIYEVFR
jgi:YYY domain-containing protein